MIGSPKDVEQFKEEWKNLLRKWEPLKDRLHKKKLKALHQLKENPRIADRVNMPTWKYKILLLKLEQLKEASTPEDINEILMEAKSDHKGVRIPLHSKYWLLEEEALIWMEKSLEAPLSSEGFARYMAVFRQLCVKYNMSEAYEAVFGKTMVL